VIRPQADCVDTDQRNLDLSTMRAQNTLQDIKDIMGSAFADSRITLRGLGEQLAKEAGDADHTKNPARVNRTYPCATFTNLGVDLFPGVELPIFVADRAR
jgi:hypothetical protein